LFLSGHTYSQNEDNIREEVRVINIEVPVRVYDHGKPVGNLTKADFTLYEGKERRHSDHHN
jgi:hypothetical protein